MYALNAEYAREGSGSTGGVIRETGKYKGKIEWARELRYDNGTIIVELRFNSDQGSANLKMFVNDYDGETSFGMKQLNAVMACLKIKNINPMQGMVEAYDPDTQQVGQVSATVFPELAGKKIGFLLEAQHSTYNGNPQVQMLIKAPFTFDKEQTAKEVLDNKGECEGVAKMVPLLKDKHKKEKGVTGSIQAQPNNSMDELQDDSEIPF